MKKTLLEVRGLMAGYGGGNILQGIDLSVEAGEIVTVIGRNGVGKTTLMRALIGLIPARAGEIRLGGQALNAARADQRAAAGIGYVPQGREIFPSLTVEENLLMGETINRAKKAPRPDLVYEYFPILHERRRQAAGTFSGGQQQMLSIGRALVGQPRLLLLDEPSLGIQPSIVLEIGETLRRLNRAESLTILLVEQNLKLVERMAQRGYAMDKGRLVTALDAAALMDRDVLAEHLSV